MNATLKCILAGCAAFLVTFVVLTACFGASVGAWGDDVQKTDTDTADGKCTVTFIDNGWTLESETQTVEYGGYATEISEAGCSYYSDKDCTVPFDFSTPITEDTTIYVKGSSAESILGVVEAIFGYYFALFVGMVGLISIGLGYWKHSKIAAVVGIVLVIVAVAEVCRVYDVIGGIKQ